MATRRSDPYAFDHGAQYFTVRSPEFRQFLKSFVSKGAVTEWEGRFCTIGPDGRRDDHKRKDTAYVSVPAMNALVKDAIEPRILHTGKQVEGVEGEPGKWSLLFADGSRSDAFDWIISTAPSHQTKTILPPGFSGQDSLGRAEMTPCFTLMIGYEQAFDLPFVGAKIDHPVLSWIAVNHSKPGRPESSSIVVHAGQGWSVANLENDKQVVAEEMEAAVREVLPEIPGKPAHTALHRWRYADIAQSAGSDYLIDESMQLAACGDWCVGGRVEGAFTSGLRLGDALTDLLNN